MLRSRLILPLIQKSFRTSQRAILESAKPMPKEESFKGDYLHPGEPRLILEPHRAQHETAEEFDKRFLTFFDRKDLDGWMVRKGLTALHQHDIIPEPKIIESALRACRRVNDYALAVRFLETLRLKCGKKVKEIYPWLIQEIAPTLKELGINTPEEMGYDKPEFFMPSPDYWEWDEDYAKEYDQQYKEAVKKYEALHGAHAHGGAHGHH